MQSHCKDRAKSSFPPHRVSSKGEQVMGTDWRGQGNNEPNYSTESRGQTAHKSLIFVSKASSYNLEHPGKKTFPLKKNLFCS